MKKQLGLIVVLLPWGIVGCSHVVHGHVIEKRVEPASELLMPMTMNCGKDCSFTTYFPFYFPESYVVVVSGPDKHGELVKEELYESATEWSAVKVGDIYECGGNREKECVSERPRKPKPQ